MNKVLITGGAGYIGSILTEKLLQNGYNVTVLDSLIYNQLSLLGFCHNKQFKFVHGDVRNENLLKELVEEVDIIIPFTIMEDEFVIYHQYETLRLKLWLARLMLTGWSVLV